LWQNEKTTHWINKPDTVKRYAESFASVGVDPFIWAYPWWNRVNEYLDRISQCLTDDIVGVIHDPERGVKAVKDSSGKQVTRQNVAQSSREIILGTRQMNPYLSVGFSSYGQTKGHDTFPWDEWFEPGVFDPFEECDWFAPQLYDETPKNIVKGIQSYINRDAEAVIVPAFGTYRWVKKDASQPLSNKNRMAVPCTQAGLRKHLGDFQKSPVAYNAMVGWAENFMTPELWRVLAEEAERLVPGSTPSVE